MIITRVYKPAVDASNTFPTSAPAITFIKKVTLTYPYISPINTLLLRGPELHNKHEPYQRRILRQSRGGTLLCFRDTIWPRYTRMSYTFIALRQTEAQNLQSFVIQSLGLEIGLLDFNSQQWRGYITSPDGEISQIGKGCQWTGKLTFELMLV